MITSVPLFLLILIVCVEFRNFQRFNPTEMKTVIDRLNSAKSESFVQCDSQLKKLSFPESSNLYILCDSGRRETENLFLEANPQRCSRFDCWESQLTETSRFEILHIMNILRQKVAEGTCERCSRVAKKKQLVFELRWVMVLEKFAQMNVKECHQYDIQEYNNTFGGPYEDRMTYIQTISTSFEMRTTFQREIRIILWRLLNENYFHDWEENGDYGKGLMFDVGCAFILRRNVSYFVTSFKEVVKGGNVGHSTCSFATIAKSPISPDGWEPSNKNCMSTTVTYPTTLDPFSYYPSLCKISLPLVPQFLSRPMTFCELDPYYLKQNFCDKPVESRSKETWKEVSYGYYFKFDSNEVRNNEANCNLPHPTELVKLPFESHSHDSINFACSLKQEVHVRGEQNCKNNWNCKDSQLKDETKERILASLNKARSSVAKGECPKDCAPHCEYCNEAQYCDIMKLRWHWFLEMFAARTVGGCYNSDAVTEIRIDGPFPDPIAFEITAVLFDLPSSGQINLPDRISKLFWMNAFGDWSESKQFRRGNALWFGCAIIIQPNIKPNFMKPEYRLENGIATYIVCVYGAPHEKFLSTPGSYKKDCCMKCSHADTWHHPCTINSTKNFDPYPELCTSTSPVVTMTCEVNTCETGESEAWETVLPGSTIYEDVDGSYRKVDRQPRSPSTRIPPKATPPKATLPKATPPKPTSPKATPTTTKASKRTEMFNTTKMTFPKGETLPEEKITPTKKTTSQITTKNPFTSEKPITTEKPISEPSPIIHAYARKYCTILYMILLILSLLLSVVLSLIFKFRVEKQVFEKNSSLR